jgi:hypothetical protein
MQQTQSTPLTFISRNRIVAQEVAKEIISVLFRRVKRTKSQVNQDYNLGSWQKKLESQPWVKAGSLENYVNFSGGNKRVAKIDGRLYTMSDSEYYRFRNGRIQQLVKTHFGSEAEVVELGSGAGTNIFALSLLNHWKSLRGYDISKNGIQNAREIAKYFGLTNVKFDLLDLTNPNDPNYKNLQGASVFTYYCLEQLRTSVPKVLSYLLDNGVKKGLHIENAIELLNPLSPIDWATFLYIRRMDYQDNVLKELKRLEKDGRLRITKVERLNYSPTPKNDPMLIVWERI